MGGKLGTKEEGEKVIKLYKEGLSNTEIKRMLNRSEYFIRTRIEKYLNNNEIYVPGPMNDEELTRQIIEMHKEGISVRAISKIIEKSDTYVENRINRYKDNLYINKKEGEQNYEYEFMGGKRNKNIER